MMYCTLRKYLPRRKLLWALAFLVACSAIFSGGAYYYGNRALREAMADAAKDDPHWQFADVIERRARIPESVNSAVVMQTAKQLINNSRAPLKYVNWDEVNEELYRYPAARLNQKQRDTLADLLKPYAEGLVEYRKIKDLPAGRYPLTIAPDIVGTLLPHVQDARSAANALRFDAYLQMDAGDATAAADAIIACFNAGRSIGDEPFMISGMLRMSCDTIALSACERFLAQLTANDATLVRLQAAIDLELCEQFFLNGMRGDRAQGFAFLQYLRDNPSKAQSVRLMQNPTGDAVSEWLVYVPGMVARGQAKFLSHMNEAVSIAQRPYEEYQDAIADWDARSKNLSPFGRIMLPVARGAAPFALRHQAQLRCMTVAVAAERYRLQHQKWPDKLDDLVAANLIAAVPLDPYDGKPLRWKIIDNGRLVYSVGKDRTDNGGNFNREWLDKEGSDVGYELFDVGKRRQPPRPPKPIDVDKRPRPTGPP